MQRFIFGSLFLIIGFLGALLIAPNFINWNEYRDNIAENIYSRTGLNIEIRGNIKLEILPSPALLINNIHLANIEGAMTADTLKVETLEMSIALIPLLGRQLKINTIKLIKPILNIEILPDGRNNMAITVSKPINNQQSKSMSSVGLIQKPKASDTFLDNIEFGLFSLSIEDFFIQNGFISYRNHNKSRIEKIERFNGRFSLVSTSGPLESSGNAIIKGTPINYSLSTGAILKDRTLPINFNLEGPDLGTDIRFSGALTQIDKDPEIKGKLNFKTENIERLVTNFDKTPDLSSVFNQKLLITTSVKASMKRAIFPDINFSVDDTQGTGKILLLNNKITDLNVSFKFNKINLDKFIKRQSLVEGKNNIEVNQKPELVSKRESDLSESEANSFFTYPKISLGILPKDINVVFDLSSSAIIYNKEVVRQVKVNANLEDQEITISQASALLPGSTDLGLQGIIFSKSNAGVSQFEGTADLLTNNLQAFLNWLRVEQPAAPSDRLRRLALSGKILANEKELSFKNIRGQIDDTKFTANVATLLKKRPLIDLNLTVNQLNLDGYLQSTGTKDLNTEDINIKNKNLSSARDRILESKSINSLSKFLILRRFDANFKISLDKLIIRNLPIKKTIVLGKLRNAKLILSNLEFGDAAGVSAKFEGKIYNADKIYNALDPIFNDFRFKIYVKDFKRALNSLEIKKPAISEKVGRVKLSGKLKGNLKKMDISADLALLGARITYNGLIESIERTPLFKARVSLLHPSLSNLLTKLDSTYQLRKKQSDRVNIMSNVTGGLTEIKFSDLSGKVSDIEISGEVMADLTRPLPLVNVNLRTNTIKIDDLLPPKDTAFFSKLMTKYHNSVYQGLNHKPRVVRASYSVPPRKIDNHLAALNLAQRNLNSDVPWTKDAIDISFIRKFAGDVKLQIKSLRFKKHRVDNINTVVTINNNVMSIKRLTGDAYDGIIELDGEFVAANVADQFKTRFKVVNVNTAKFLASMGTHGFRRGALDMTSEFNSMGRSAVDHINTLGGKGTISIRGLEFSSGARKNAVIPGFADLFLSLQKFSNTIMGDKLVSKRTNFNTSFTASKGTVRFKDMTLRTGLGGGTAEGSIDLPNWQITTNGEIKLSQNILSQILVNESSKPVFLPFNIKGRLDNPSVKLKTSEITKGGIRLPIILNKTINKMSKKKGVDAVLEKIFPKANSIDKKRGKSPLDAILPNKKKLPGNNKIRTQDFLKNILRELAN